MDNLENLKSKFSKKSETIVNINFFEGRNPFFPLILMVLMCFFNIQIPNFVEELN